MKTSAPFKRTTISQMTDAVVNNAMHMDKSGDAEVLAKSKERWEDLTRLCNEVGGALLELLNNVDMLTNQTSLPDLLGADYPEFTKHINAFHRDIGDFTNRMAEARSTHEGKEGLIESLEDMAEFARLSMLYLSISNEINQILGLSVASMFLMLSEAESRQRTTQEATTVADAEVDNVPAEIVGHPV